jgi:hypothetical protein
MFVSDTLWLCDVEWWSVCDLCMHVCLLCIFIFPAIDSNDECAEEGEVLECQEEGGQGQANQGKPSTCAYLNPIMSLCIVLLLSLLLCSVFVLLCPLYSNSWRLSSTSQIIIISKDDTIDTYSIPWKVETRWLASRSLENTCSGAKNSRIGNTFSGKYFEKSFENFGVATTPLRCFEMIS